MTRSTKPEEIADDDTSDHTEDFIRVSRCRHREHSPSFDRSAGGEVMRGSFVRRTGAGARRFGVDRRAGHRRM